MRMSEQLGRIRGCGATEKACAIGARSRINRRATALLNVVLTAMGDDAVKRLKDMLLKRIMRSRNMLVKHDEHRRQKISARPR